MNNYDNLAEILSDIKLIGKKKFIIVTGGIGDFLTIDYFLSFSSKKNIIFLSKQSLKLKQIYNFYYPGKKHYSLLFNFSLIGKPGFNNSKELLKFFPIFKNIHIVNIGEYFSLIKKKYLICRNNKLSTQIVNINIKSILNIPDIFAIINPYTEDNRIGCINCNVCHKNISNCNLTRNFVSGDYINVFNFLKETKITGVIISVLPIHIPIEYQDFNIINLSDIKITIIDCIELVKQCNYFFGIDSFLSVIASKHLPQNNIYVKCNNKHAYNNKDIYWFPNKNINLQSFINI
jgi:hypothetical protein